MSFHTDACPHSLPPFIDGIINDGLPKLWPQAYLNQTLFQLVDVAYAFLVHAVLKIAPTL